MLLEPQSEIVTYKETELISDKVDEADEHNEAYELDSKMSP